MINLFKIISVIAYLFAACLSARHFIHMFQLNSYKPKVQIKWLFSHASTYMVAHLIVLVIAIALSAICTNALIPLVLTAILILLTALPQLPKGKDKVSLKYTARVKRLIITLAILYIIPIILLFTISMKISVPLMALWIFLVPWMVLLANLINRPMELAINQHYINDAKRILADCPNLTVIGITGSFGKTSVKYFLDSLLSVKYNVLKTPGNFNTPLGVVKTIRGSLRATHDIFLCEMGAKNVGDIKEICDIVHPTHGIITSVGEMHLESFGSIENVRKTKFELADAVKDKGMLFLNMDNGNIQSVAQNYEHISYGIDDRSGYYVTDLSISEKGSGFTVHSPDGKSCEYRTPLIGRHNVINICGAIAVANSLGITLEELKAPVRKLESVPHRLQLINKGDYTVIDDAYNSNPSGAKAALEALSMTDGMKILVTPGMIELGSRQYDLNKEFGSEAASVCDYVALVGSAQTKPIHDGLTEAGYPEDKIIVSESLNEAMGAVYSLTTDGKRKIILLENDLPDNY